MISEWLEWPVGRGFQWVIKQALDTGLYGLVFVHLRTVEDPKPQSKLKDRW